MSNNNPNKNNSPMNFDNIISNMDTPPKKKNSSMNFDGIISNMEAPPKNKNSSMNFDNILSNNGAPPKAKSWFRRKAGIVTMCSTLAVGVAATGVTVPVFLFTDVIKSSSSTTDQLPPTTTPPVTNPDLPPIATDKLQEKINMFNSQTKNAKIADFNKMITLPFQNKIYDFWLEDFPKIAADNSLLFNSPFYKYVWNNLDPLTRDSNSALVQKIFLKLVGDRNSIPLPSPPGAVLDVANPLYFPVYQYDFNIFNIFKINTGASINQLIALASNTHTINNPVPNTYLYNIYTLSHNNVSDFKIIVNANKTLSISVRTSSHNFVFHNTISPKPEIFDDISYNPSYTLNDEYANGLLTPLVTNFLNTKYK